MIFFMIKNFSECLIFEFAGVYFLRIWIDERFVEYNKIIQGENYAQQL